MSEYSFFAYLRKLLQVSAISKQYSSKILRDVSNFKVPVVIVALDAVVVVVAVVAVFVAIVVVVVVVFVALDAVVVVAVVVVVATHSNFRKIHHGRELFLMISLLVAITMALKHETGVNFKAKPLLIS